MEGPLTSIINYLLLMDTNLILMYIHLSSSGLSHLSQLLDRSATK